MFNIPYMPTYPGLCQALIHCNLLNYGNGLLPDSITPVLEEGKRSFFQTGQFSLGLSGSKELSQNKPKSFHVSQCISQNFA